VTLRITDSLCLLKHKKKVIAGIDVSDMYINGIFDLGQFFQRLENEAGILNISQLKVAPSKKIFDTISMESFKIMGNKKLQSLRVALLNAVTLLSNNDKEKQALLFTFREDAIKGDHIDHIDLSKDKKEFLLEKYDPRYNELYKKMPKIQNNQTYKNTIDYY